MNISMHQFHNNKDQGSVCGYGLWVDICDCGCMILFRHQSFTMGPTNLLFPVQHERQGSAKKPRPRRHVYSHPVHGPAPPRHKIHLTIESLINSRSLVYCDSHLFRTILRLENCFCLFAKLSQQPEVPGVIIANCVLSWITKNMQRRGPELGFQQ